VGIDGKAWGDEGGKEYDDYRAVIEKLKIDFLVTEEEAVETLEAVKGDKRHPHLRFTIDGKSHGGKGGKHGDDYWIQVEVLVQGGRTRQDATEHLTAQQGEALHPYLQGKALQRAGHNDTGSAAYRAEVQALVRASHASLAISCPDAKSRPHARRLCTALQRQSHRNFKRLEIEEVDCVSLAERFVVRQLVCGSKESNTGSARGGRGCLKRHRCLATALPELTTGD
jgi:hypothetical protein